MFKTRLKNKMGPIIEHNTQTDYHIMALSGLTRLAATESPCVQICFHSL